MEEAQLINNKTPGSKGNQPSCEPDFRAIFESAPGLYLVLDPRLHIVAVSDAYAQATMTERPNILGRYCFDVFPPNDPDVDSFKNIHASLLRVIETKSQDTLPVQKYDVRKPLSEGGEFEIRYWSIINSPVLNQRRELAYIIHRVEDVTEFINLKLADQKQNEINQELHSRMEMMESEVYLRARQLAEANEKLRLSEDNLSVTLDSIADAVLVTDSDGMIVRLNPVAEELTGWKKSDAFNRHISEVVVLLEPDTRHRLPLPFLETLANRFVSHSENRAILVSRDGRERYISESVSIIQGADESLIGAIKIFRDITSEYNQTQALQREKLKAEVANRTKDSFLATMSHEIRTPLSGLLGMLELIEMTPLGKEQKEMLQAARSSGRGLLRILSDILDWSKIEAGKLELAPAPNSIAQILNEVVNTYSHIASSKGLKLWQTMDPRVHGRHIVDSLRLSQILNNFVSNAIKFTNRGEVELIAQLLDERPGYQTIKFSVRDTGIGMNPEEQTRLFELYSQAGAKTARMYGGTGLGLAISRRLASLMDGIIEFSSAHGKGSIFSFTTTIAVTDLPLENDREIAASTSQVTSIVSRNKDKPRILVVDDHTINLGLLTRQIELLGLEAVGAADGEIALQLWKQGGIDLIITDCHMPRMDGYELTRRIRDIERDRQLQHIPVIAYTANALSEENDQCNLAGMNEVLVKPANIVRLRETLLKWLPEKLQIDNNPANAKHFNQPKSPPFSIETIKEIIPDPAEQVAMLGKFQTYQLLDFEKMLIEMDHGNLAGLLHLAHKLKGSTRMIGANELGDIYAKIETLARNSDLHAIQREIEALRLAIVRFNKMVFSLIKQYEEGVQS